MELEKVKDAGASRKPNLAALERWEATWRRLGDEAAVRLPDGSVARTFAQIESEANGVAADLEPWPPGAVVSLCAGNVPGWPALLLGIWKAGGVALLVDATLAEAQVVVAERDCGARARVGWRGDGFEVRCLEGNGAWRPGDATILIKLTSGTTGAARASEFGPTEVMADCDQVCETMGITAGDVNYGVIAFAHSYGFSNLVTPLILRGVPLVAALDSLPRALWRGVAESGATVLPAVPAIFRALAGVAADPGRLRLCLSAGAPLPSRIAGQFREAHGLKIHSFYGASECGGICYDASEVGELPDGFVGLPMRGVELTWDGEGVGGVRVRSAAVCLGMGGELRPGDLLEGDETSGYRIAGRTSDVVNVGGRKVNPAAVEAALADHPGVREVAVFGRGDAARSESLAAVVVGEVTGGELRRWCAERLANWQVPREIFEVSAIPVSARGKVNRRDLANWSRTMEG